MVELFAAPSTYQTEVVSTYDGYTETHEQDGNSRFEVDTHATATASATSDPSQIYQKISLGTGTYSLNADVEKTIYGGDYTEQGTFKSVSWPSGFEFKVSVVGDHDDSAWGVDLMEYYGGSNSTNHGTLNQDPNGDSIGWITAQSNFYCLSLWNTTTGWRDYSDVTVEVRAPINASATVDTKNVVTDDVKKTL